MSAWWRHWYGVIMIKRRFHHSGLTLRQSALTSCLENYYRSVSVLMLAKQILMWRIKSHIVKQSNNNITWFSGITKSHLTLRQTAVGKLYLTPYASGFMSYKRFPPSVRDRSIQITKYLGGHPSEFSNWKNYLTGAGRLATLQFRLDRTIIIKKCKLGMV